MKKIICIMITALIILPYAMAYAETVVECEELLQFRAEWRDRLLACPTQTWTGDGECKTYAGTTFIITNKTITLNGGKEEVSYDLNNCSKVDSCASCYDGYHLEDKSLHYGTVTINDVCDDPDNRDIDIHEFQSICVKDCAPCTNCSDSFELLSEGYEKWTERVCDCGVCDATVHLRCADGYWGRTTNGTSGCQRCPAVDSTLTPIVYGTSNAGSNTDITSCFLEPGNYKDRTGSFTISKKNCPY